MALHRRKFNNDDLVAILALSKDATSKWKEAEANTGYAAVRSDWKKERG